jgi:hypothetical protein
MKRKFLSRRRFLQTSAATVASLSATGIASAAPTARATRCIVLFLTGGPSQLETFDPKPEAPSSYPNSGVARAIFEPTVMAQIANWSHGNK